jgi:hypothetical protein
MDSESKSNVVGVIKEWITPFLITILGMFIWRDLSELRDDVKFLVKEQGIGSIKITMLETRLSFLEDNFKDVNDKIYRMSLYGTKQDEIRLPKPALSK